MIDREGLAIASDSLLRAVEALLTEIDRQGYVIVPKVPTEWMLRAGAYMVSGLRHEGARYVYTAMLAAHGSAGA